MFKSIRMSLPKLLIATVLATQSLTAWPYVTVEDQQLINAAECEEIAKEYRNYSAAAKNLEEEIRQSASDTTTGNVIGAATLAVFGLGFFSWDDNSDAKTNLAELIAYRDAIADAGRQKSCAM